MKSYNDIKRDIKRIAAETTSNGNSIESGFGHASEEYWLGPMEINNFGPSYLVKFMASVAILKLRNDANLEQDNSLKEIAFYLTGKLSKTDIKKLSPTCIKNILSDAKDVYEFNWYIIHETLLNET